MKGSLNILLFIALLLSPPNVEKPVIVLTGQSNMLRSAEQVAVQMPDHEIVTCAVGGTSITEWQRGLLLYEDCLAAVEGKSIVGIFHFQGEHEAQNPDTYFLWSRLTLRFFRDFVQDTGATEAQIVFAKLGTLPTNREYPYWAHIQNQQERFRENHPEYRIVRTEDITPYCPADGPHWCDDGYVRIARRFISKFSR